MTKIKLCGLSRPVDIENANELQPDYIGFVFAPKSKRYVSYQKALSLKQMLSNNIQAVGVFVNEDINIVAEALNNNIIDIAQLHGSEDDDYIRRLRNLTNKPIIQAFKIKSIDDVNKAVKSPSDHILLDAGAGDGTTFDWSLLNDIKRPYFLAGGLSPENINEALANLKPYGVDVSSGIETNGLKDKEKMIAFVKAVRKEATL